MRSGSGRHSGPAAHRGFTLIQLLVAVGILATLAGLLLVAMRAARASAVAGADTQIKGTIATGMTGFISSFDFAPPLVKDQSDKTGKGTIVKVKVNSTDVYAIAVYTPAADADFLRGPGVADINNPLRPTPKPDLRYSNDSLGIYLAGALEVPLRSDKADVPIDLVSGPGTGRPNLSGSFEKGKFGPFIDASSRTLQIVRNDDISSLNPTAELQDRNRVPIRYYRWLKNKNVSTWDDLNIPAMVVGPDYAKYSSKTAAADRAQPDAQVTGANWAFVMAGPNRVFGDEDIAVIVQALQSTGASVDASMPEAMLRARAWADNLVEAGSAIN